MQHNSKKRQNSKNKEEVSAIDFVVAEKSVEDRIDAMKIDEDGLLRLKGHKDTDHNTITITMNIEKCRKKVPDKRIKWNISAPNESWRKFRWELEQLEDKAEKIFDSENDPLDKQYKKWLKNIEGAA